MKIHSAIVHHSSGQPAAQLRAEIASLEKDWDDFDRLESLRHQLKQLQA